MAFFEGLGVPLKTERGRRVFPQSDNARDISGALRNRMRRLGVQVESGRAAQILTGQGRVRGVLLQDGRELAGDGVILATGGLSYPTTGSDGDGYAMAAALGHAIQPPVPSLIWLKTREKDPARLEGLSLRNTAAAL